MSKASDLTFIRTQAENLAWLSVAAQMLVTMGVVSYEDALTMKRIAQVVIDRAKQDPKFIGDKLPQEFK